MKQKILFYKAKLRAKTLLKFKAVPLSALIAASANYCCN